MHSFVDEFHRKIGELPMAPSKKSKQTRFAKEKKAQKKAPNKNPIKNAVHIKKAEHKKALGNAAKPVFDALTYKKECSKPRYYGSVTIYSDMRGQQWRVKPAPARRDERKFPRTPSGWKAVIKHVKSLKQV